MLIGNIRDAIRDIVADQPRGQASAVLLSAGVELWWRSKLKLTAKTRRCVSTFANYWRQTPDRSAAVVMVRTNTPAAIATADALVASGRFSRVCAPVEPDGTTSFVLPRR